LALPSIDLMKIDIEGFEYEAILGSPTAFREHRVKAVALELHPEAIRERDLKPEAIVSFLENCGYRRAENFSTLVYCAPSLSTS
jgi:hypothetical protein